MLERRGEKSYYYRYETAGGRSRRIYVASGGGAIGLYAQSEKSSRDTWKFFDLKITEHSPTQ